MRLRPALLIACSVLLVVPLAAQGRLSTTPVLDLDETGPAEVQLDDDPAMERVLAVSSGDEFPTYVPRLQDDCQGRTRTWPLGPRNERVAVELVRAARGQRPLLATFGSSGASGRIGHFRLARLGPRTDAAGCARIKTLFRFPHRATRTPRPPKGMAPGSFSARVRAVGEQVWVRTYEGLYRRTDAGCCPSASRTIDWRYDARRDRYVRHRTRVERVGRSTG